MGEPNMPGDPLPSARPHARLADYTTFGLGGPCRTLWPCATPDQLTAALSKLRQQAVPYALMGGGSNLLVDDTGLDLSVVRYFSTQPDIQINGNQVLVSGATLLDALAATTAAAGLDGVVYCSGIPGTVGGAVVGNAGAFGQQIGDVVAYIDYLEADGTRRQLPGTELGFAYRQSNLRSRGGVVLAAALQLRPGNVTALQAQREERLQLRRAKHPDWRTEPCIGSIFRNIEPTSAAGRRQAAGWFLEQAGAKSMRVGGAYVYPKHANIIVRTPDGTAHDVKDLADRMQAAVRAAFGFTLHREVILWGDFAGI